MPTLEPTQHSPESTTHWGCGNHKGDFCCGCYPDKCRKAREPETTEGQTQFCQACNLKTQRPGQCPAAMCSGGFGCTHAVPTHTCGKATQPEPCTFVFCDNEEPHEWDSETCPPRNQSDTKPDYKKIAEELSEYSGHKSDCIRSSFSQGRPIPKLRGGGYEQKFNGKWYMTSPVDKSPKCSCGFSEIIEPLLPSYD